MLDYAIPDDSDTYLAPRDALLRGPWEQRFETFDRHKIPQTPDETNTGTAVVGQIKLFNFVVVNDRIVSNI